MPITDHPTHIPLEDSKIIWRYINIKKFESLLKERALFFSRLDNMPDNYEGAVLKREAEYRNSPEQARNHGYTYDEEKAKKEDEGFKLTHQKVKRGTTISCWHINENESQGMWDLYIKEGEIGLVIQSTVGRLKESLSACEQNIGMTKVRYLNYEKDVWYDEKDYPIHHYNFMTPLSHKRIEYKHEAEYRLYHHKTEAEVENYWEDRKGEFVKADIEILIQKVVLHPKTSNSELEQIQAITNMYGYVLTIEKSKLSDEPFF